MKTWETCRCMLRCEGTTRPFGTLLSGDNWGRASNESSIMYIGAAMHVCSPKVRKMAIVKTI